jgi:hypothetical protein
LVRRATRARHVWLCPQNKHFSATRDAGNEPPFVPLGAAEFRCRLTPANWGKSPPDSDTRIKHSYFS